MIIRRNYNWQCRERTVKLGERTLIMGILNVTPDSFSDAGSFFDPNAAVDRALAMVAEGADIIDIGGESTRPGAVPVPATEEVRRTAPIIRKIREHSDVLISIDTMKAVIAREALEAGADIINDVSAFEYDTEMIGVASESSAGVVLMHMKGIPGTMQNNPTYTDVVEEVGSYLKERLNFAISHGVKRDRIAIDPGIGFGKTLEHNLALLRTIHRLAECGSPVLVGASRKNFIGLVTRRENPEERLAGSLGAAAWAVLDGAHILRVHDVIDTCDVCRMLDTLLNGGA